MQDDPEFKKKYLYFLDFQIRKRTVGSIRKIEAI